jgi:hypothetical protein
MDCHVVTQLKRVRTKWFFFDAAMGQWYLIPEGKLRFIVR